MDQSNNIANFGRNAGNNVLASYLNGADRKRQKTNDFYNRIFQQDQLRKQEEQITYEREQDQYNKEKELSLGAVQALASTDDPNQRAQIWQGYRQSLANDLGADVSVVPETYSDEIFNKLVGKTGYDLNRGQKTPAEVQALRAKFELARLSPEEEQKATRINLGLDGRAVGSAAQTIANTQGQTEIVANSEAAIKGQVAGSQEEAKLSAQGELKPKIEADITTAREFAKSATQKQIEQQGQAQKLEAVDQIYNNLIGSDLDKIYGKGETLYPEFLRSQEGVNLIAQRDQMIALLQLGARGELKGQGPITDSEQGILSRAVSILSNPEISPDLARKAIKDARNVLYKNAGQEAPADVNFSSLNDDDLLNF